MTDTSPVRVRFAPSPTGDLHIGGGRTALFNWLFAKHFGGKFILRIEDTDQKRTKEESLGGILDGLHWLGLQWDEGPDIGGPYAPYVQSERIELYQKWANWLVEQGKAYKAFETPEELAKLEHGYDRRGRALTPDDWARLEAEGHKPVIRFKMPLEGETAVIDMVRGPITVQNDKLQDLVLLKADGYPTYHLANVIDDHYMEISHVIRAEEWISTAPVHRQLYDAFGWVMPFIAHVPVILKAPPGKGKMSKRDEGASISYFQQGGYLPEVVTNFLCNVGWNYGVMDDKGEEIQIFSKEQAAEIFDITRVSTSGTKFDLVKLQWLNGEYLRLMDTATLADMLHGPLEAAGFQVDMDKLRRVTPLIRERIKLLPDVVDKAGFFFRNDLPPIAPESLLPKKMTPDDAIRGLSEAGETLDSLPSFIAPDIEAALRALADTIQLNPGQLFSVIRNAVTGQQVTPPLFESLEVIGKPLSLVRIGEAVTSLENWIKSHSN